MKVYQHFKQGSLSMSQQQLSYARCIFSVAATLLASQFLLEFSCCTSLYELKEHIVRLDLKFLLLNYFTLFSFWSVIFVIANRVWLSNILFCGFCGGLSIVNYYVITLHSMPLSFLLLRNFTTALNVISGYRFEFSITVVILALVTVLLLWFNLHCRQHLRVPQISLRFLLLRNIILIFAAFSILYFGYFSAKPIKPKHTIGWLWNEAYYQYGYTGCTIETLCQLMDSINEPEGYSEAAVDAVSIPLRDSIYAPSQPVDILLILNESFYDLAQITNPQADQNYFENISNLKNLLTGYAVVPGAGGSTNSAEYELLTSNSLQIMPGVTPFNTLDLHGANSIVSHLAALGYSTLSCHPEPAASYSRAIAYPQLGFQKSFFESDFQNRSFYYNREHETDACVYENLIRWYEAQPEDSPRFIYALTLQNHGNWDRNAEEYDIIHATTNYGSSTKLVNEYLSCISLSDQAFAELIEYFSQIDRNVIICMTGDHAPSFAPNIVDETYSSEEKALRIRKVPLLIWSNFSMEQKSLGTMSMNYVVPTLLELAGVPLSPYYSYILQLKEQIPILSSYGSYYDTEGNLYKYNSDSGAPYESLVDNYFYLEYNNLQKERKQQLFNPVIP